jgi:hypothetical protein
MAMIRADDESIHEIHVMFGRSDAVAQAHPERVSAPMRSPCLQRSNLDVAIQGQSEVRELVIEAMISIAQGENPRAIESKLQGYLH